MAPNDKIHVNYTMIQNYIKYSYNNNTFVLWYNILWLIESSADYFFKYKSYIFHGNLPHSFFPQQSEGNQIQTWVIILNKIKSTDIAIE